MDRISSSVWGKGTGVVASDKSCVCGVASRETKALMLHLVKYSLELKKIESINVPVYKRLLYQTLDLAGCHVGNVIS